MKHNTELRDEVERAIRASYATKAGVAQPPAQAQESESQEEPVTLSDDQ